MTHPSIEESLTDIEEKAALLRYLASGASMNIEPPNQTVLGGIESLCSEIAGLANGVRRALSADALMTTTRPRR